MYSYILMCVYIYMCTTTYICVHVHMNTYVSTYTCTYMTLCLDKYVLYKPELILHDIYTQEIHQIKKLRFLQYKCKWHQNLNLNVYCKILRNLIFLIRRILGRSTFSGNCHELDTRECVINMMQLFGIFPGRRTEDSPYFQWKLSWMGHDMTHSKHGDRAAAKKHKHCTTKIHLQRNTHEWHDFFHMLDLTHSKYGKRVHAKNHTHKNKKHHLQRNTRASHDVFHTVGVSRSKHGKQGDLSRLCVAVCCSVLQCVAVCCNVLQCVAVCCSLLQSVAMSCSAWQCVAVCCSASQCVLECCRVLQCVAVCWVTPKKEDLSRPHPMCVYVLQMYVCMCCRYWYMHMVQRWVRPHMHLWTHEGNAQGLKRLENTQTNENLVVMLVDFFCCFLNGLAWRRSFAKSCVANNDTDFNMYVCIRVYN